jgi:hypothetical protein
MIQFRRACATDADQIQRLYQVLVKDPNIRVTASSIEAIEHNSSNILIVGISVVSIHILRFST